MAALRGHGHVVLLGLRGTFEPFDRTERGLGPTLDALASRIERALEDRSPQSYFEAVGVDYPATAFPYWRSRNLGALALASAADSVVRGAPDTALVLAGLSQGADALRQALGLPAMRRVSSRIAALVLLGDPTRRPDEGSWHHGTRSHANGLLAHWSKPIPAALRGRTWSFCLENDRVAANTNGLRALWRSGTHTKYEINEAGVLDLAAAFVVDSLGQRVD